MSRSRGPVDSSDEDGASGSDDEEAQAPAAVAPVVAVPDPNKELSDEEMRQMALDADQRLKVERTRELAEHADVKRSQHADAHALAESVVEHTGKQERGHQRIAPAHSLLLTCMRAAWTWLPYRYTSTPVCVDGAYTMRELLGHRPSRACVLAPYDSSQEEQLALKAKRDRREQLRSEAIKETKKRWAYEMVVAKRRGASLCVYGSSLHVCLFVCFIASQHTLNKLRLQR